MGAGKFFGLFFGLFRNKMFFFGFFSVLLLVISLAPVIREAYEQNEPYTFLDATGKMIFEHDVILYKAVDDWIADGGIANLYFMLTGIWFLYIFGKIIYFFIKMRNSSAKGANIIITVLILAIFEMFHHLWTYDVWVTPLSGAWHFIWNIPFILGGST